MKYRATAKVRAQVRSGTVGTGWVLLALLAVLAVAVPSCNFFNDYGNDWANAEATSAGVGGNMCAGFGGYGGEGGAGGDDEGAGGDDEGDEGVGGSPGVGSGVGGSFGDAVGTSVGAGAGDARSGWAEGHVARAPHHHRGRRGGIGSVRQAGCGSSTDPQVQQALAALGSADPTEIADADLEAAYTASLIEQMIQQNVTDPSTVSDSTLQQMAAQYAPAAAAQAQQWVQSLSSSAVPLFTPDPAKMGACIDEFGCKPIETCPFSNTCWLVDCGTAKCSKCPTNFQPSKLLFTGWCAHTCLGTGTPPPIVGFKAVIHFRGGASYNYCYQIAND